MAVKVYKYDDKTQLTKHFNVQEFKCKCGKNHEIKIDDQLPILLEKLMTKLKAKRGNIYSGYRCSEYDKKVGGRGTGSHTFGYSVDIRFLDNNGKVMKSSTVALALEDMNHQYGIGYRAGGAQDYQGNIHIDTRPRKWYGDESISNVKAIWQIKKGCYSFYDYLGIKKTQNEIKSPVSRDETRDQIEVLIDNLNVRVSPNGKRIGSIKKGIYNIYDKLMKDNYWWYKVQDNGWIASKEGSWTKLYLKEEKPDETIPEPNTSEDIKKDQAEKDQSAVTDDKNQPQEPNDGDDKPKKESKFSIFLKKFLTFLGDILVRIFRR